MVITIGGEYGCGSQEIAEELAKITGYRFCDNDIVKEAMKDFGVDTEAETFSYYDESTGDSTIKDIRQISNHQRRVVEALSFDVLPLDRRMDKAMREVQNRLADEGNCILVGRCANYYLRGRKDVMSLFFADKDEQKVKRIMGKLECDEKEAEKTIKKTDKRRADFYSYFTGESWDDPDNYDARIKTGLLGVEKTAQMIAEMIRLKEAE